MNAYETAMDSLNEENANMKKKLERMRSAHVQNIQHFQVAMQARDSVFWSLEQRKTLRKNSKWMHLALEEAMEHHKRLKTFAGVSHDNIFQVNVYPLYMYTQWGHAKQVSWITFSRFFRN